jgi:hypothetical protein
MKTIAKVLTEQQVRNESIREYNPQEWDNTVSRYMKYRDVTFYKVDSGNGYEYDRYYVTYQLPEGLRLMQTLSYSSSLTSAGFRNFFANDLYIDADGSFKRYPDGQVELDVRGVFGPDGNECALNNSKEARAWMTERSVKYGAIYTQRSL